MGLCINVAASQSSIPAKGMEIPLQNDANVVALGSMIENTLVILKPDCMEKKLSGTVIDRVQQAGLKIVACKMMGLHSELLRDHYSHLVNFSFFPEIVEFMSSSPVIILVLQGNDGIKKVRDLLGPTDSSQAPKGTIRGDFGQDKMRNIAHASDSAESAQKEIKRFFSEFELFL
ncbi:MAG: nucleoside-diphosphate kinase [Puniceicoccales bacterium]|jgi:nucleoside-diphosphate kinase|nr:nucleoside-diphosphate kinase [Puniceicoccales bacterium]